MSRAALDFRLPRDETPSFIYRSRCATRGTYQWLGTFGNAGNGEYRAELRRAVAAIQANLKARHFSEAHDILRLDGHYGTGAVLSDLAGLVYVTREQNYHLLDRDEVQIRLHLPPDQQMTHPESGICRTLYDCPEVPLGREGKQGRVVVATHLASEKPSRVGVTRSGMVYELFLTNLPQGTFTAADVVALYLHRGAFENALSDEDAEQDPERWRSQAAWGQECWQIISQWVWNLHLGLGHHLKPEPVRTTEFALALPAAQTARVVYAASIRSCCPCLLREQSSENSCTKSKKSPLPRSSPRGFSCLCCFLSQSYATGCAGDIT